MLPKEWRRAGELAVLVQPLHNASLLRAVLQCAESAKSRGNVSAVWCKSGLVRGFSFKSPVFFVGPTHVSNICRAVERGKTGD